MLDFSRCECESLRARLAQERDEGICDETCGKNMYQVYILRYHLYTYISNIYINVYNIPRSVNESGLQSLSSELTRTSISPENNTISVHTSFILSLSRSLSFFLQACRIQHVDKIDTDSTFVSNLAHCSSPLYHTYRYTSKMQNLSSCTYKLVADDVYYSLLMFIHQLFRYCAWIRLIHMIISIHFLHWNFDTFNPP